MVIYDQSTFPNMFATTAEKNNPKYGLQVAQAILSSTSQWRTAFKATLSLNRKYAEGNQDIAPYLQEMDIDAKDMFTNISYKARPIAQSFIRAVVGGYNLKNEYPNVTSLSKYIQDKKEDKKNKAAFRMENPELIQQLSQDVGFPVEDPNEFTPADAEELDIHFQLNDKEKEELMMQEMVTFALHDNDIEQIKNDVLYEQFIAQFHGYYNYIDHNGRLIIEVIQAEDIITDNSFKENFSDKNFAGRFLRMSIVDMRRQFNVSPDQEENLYKLAKNSIGKYSNPTRWFDWASDYRYSSVRPYDNFTVEVAHIWQKTAKTLRVVEGKDRYNRDVFDTDYKVSEDGLKSGGRKKVSYKHPSTAYEGYFTADASICLEWGEQKRILRDGEDKQELLCPFIFNMPENRGRMLPNSLMNMIIDSIKKMDLSILKITQIIAKAAPDGYNIDVNALLGVDLGEGELQPLKIMDIKRQTGDLFYNGKNEDGSSRPAPISDNISQFESKIQAFINTYNFELGNIRSYLGVNEFRDGSATNARTGFRFMQAQAAASNTITFFLYRAYLKSTEELLKQVGIRIFDALMQDNVNEGYQKYLGKKNIEWLKSKKEITASSYDMKFAMGISDEDKGVIEQRVEICLQNNTLQMPDAMMISRIKDPIIAERMLTYLFKKRQKETQALQAQAQQANAEQQTQIAQAAEKARQETLGLEIEADKVKSTTRGEQDRDMAMEKLAWDLILNSQTTGIEIPPQYQQIVDAVLQNRGLNVVQQTTNKEQQLEQMAQQEEQQAMQGDAEQQMQELQQLVQSGEITEEQANAEAQSIQEQMQG